MLYFWLVAAMLIFLVVTEMGLAHSWKMGCYDYLCAGLSLLMFLGRRWMMKRMERHIEFLEQQKKDEAN